MNYCTKIIYKEIYLSQQKPKLLKLYSYNTQLHRQDIKVMEIINIITYVQETKFKKYILLTIKFKLYIICNQFTVIIIM